MAWLRMHRQGATRLAWLAILALALLPTVSRALAFAGAVHGEPGWGWLCTPQGLRLATAPEAGTGSEAVEHHPLEACALCPLAAAAPPVPCATRAAWPPASAATAVPAAPLPALRAPLAWAHAQPRAPPAR